MQRVLPLLGDFWKGFRGVRVRKAGVVGARAASRRTARAGRREEVVSVRKKGMPVARPSLRAPVWIVAFAVFCAAAGGAAGQASRSVRLSQFEQFLENSNDRLGSDCSPLVNPVSVSGRYALVLAMLKCAQGEPGGRERTVAIQKAYSAVVDWKRMRLVGQEIETAPSARTLAVVALERAPAVFQVEKDSLALRVVGDDGVEVYRWDCPGGDCPRALQGQVLQGERFPDEPLRIALVGGQGYLVQLLDLYAPEEKGKKGRLAQVDELVPLPDWQREFREVARVDETLREVFLDASVLTKIASMIPLLEKEVGEEVQEAADRLVQNAPGGMSMVSTPDGQLFLATQQPFTVTRVDTRSRKFSVRPMSSFGEHIRPLSLTGNFSLLGVFPERRDVVRLVVKGPLCEPEDSYMRTHPGRSCPHLEMDAVREEKTCCYDLAAVVRLNLATDESEWQIWDEPDEAAELVVDVSQRAAACLVAPQGKPGVLLLDRCGRRH